MNIQSIGIPTPSMWDAYSYYRTTHLDPYSSQDKLRTFILKDSFFEARMEIVKVQDVQSMHVPSIEILISLKLINTKPINSYNQKQNKHIRIKKTISGNDITRGEAMKLLYEIVSKEIAIALFQENKELARVEELFLDEY